MKRITSLLLLTLVSLTLFSCKAKEENALENTDNWKVLELSNLFYSKIENDKLLLHAEVEDIPNYAFYSSEILSKGNISIETLIKEYKSLNNNNLYGIVLYSDSVDNPTEFILFSVKNNNLVGISFESISPEKRRTYYNKPMSIDSTKFNQFKITAKKDILSFYMDNQLISSIKKPNHFINNNIGFISLNNSIQVKELKLLGK